MNVPGNHRGWFGGWFKGTFPRTFRGRFQGNVPGNYRNRSREQGAGIREQRTGFPPIRSPQGDPLTSDQFGVFWKTYPNPGDREKAERAWEKWTRGATLEDILAGLERWRGSQKWAWYGIPTAKTWLQERCWMDEPTPDSGLSRIGEANRKAGERLLDRMYPKGDGKDGTAP